MPKLFNKQIIELPKYEDPSIGLKIFVCKTSDKEKPYKLFEQHKGFYNDNPILTGRFKDLETAETAFFGSIDLKKFQITMQRAGLLGRMKDQLL
jgi:hypothetical protein